MEDYFNCTEADYGDAFSEGDQPFDNDTSDQEFKKVKYFLRTSKLSSITRQTIKYNKYGDIINGILIGEHNSGWCFGLHVYPDQHIKTLNDWIEIFNLLDVKNESIVYVEDNGNEINECRIDIYNLKSVIKDGYSLESPKKIFNDCKFIKSFYRDYEDFLNRNNLIEGPNNLLRRRIDGNYCIGHGEGNFAFDYINGNFKN